MSIAVPHGSQVNMPEGSISLLDRNGVEIGRTAPGVVPNRSFKHSWGGSGRSSYVILEGRHLPLVQWPE